jgi:ribonuclease HII
VVFPTLNLEKELWSQGYSHIAGVDEAGRGSWAGPVVAAAVILPQGINLPADLRDSKLLTPKKREDLSERIKEIAIGFAVGEVAVSVIEKKGIAAAAQIAMRKALRRLDPGPDFSLIDYFRLKYLASSRQKAIVKGDLYCASISAASIIAKVYRDNLMRELDEDKDLGVYQFGKHKGYGTKLHQQLIYEHGVCRAHRFSFIPDRLKWQMSKPTNRLSASGDSLSANL